MTKHEGVLNYQSPVGVPINQYVYIYIFITISHIAYIWKKPNSHSLYSIKKVNLKNIGKVKFKQITAHPVKKQTATFSLHFF